MTSVSCARTSYGWFYELNIQINCCCCYLLRYQSKQNKRPRLVFDNTLMLEKGLYCSKRRKKNWILTKRIMLKIKKKQKQKTMFFTHWANTPHPPVLHSTLFKDVWENGCFVYVGLGNRCCYEEQILREIKLFRKIDDVFHLVSEYNTPSRPVT